MKILEVHTNHVQVEHTSKNIYDYFLLADNLDWYCIQTQLRFSNTESFAICLHSIATELYSKKFTPAKEDFRFPEYKYYESARNYTLHMEVQGDK